MIVHSSSSLFRLFVTSSINTSSDSTLTSGRTFAGTVFAVVLNLKTGFGTVTVCDFDALTAGRLIVGVGVALICVLMVERFSIADLVIFLF